MTVNAFDESVQQSLRSEPRESSLIFKLFKNWFTNNFFWYIFSFYKSFLSTSNSWTIDSAETSRFSFFIPHFTWAKMLSIFPFSTFSIVLQISFSIFPFVVQDHQPILSNFLFPFQAAPSFLFSFSTHRLLLYHNYFFSSENAQKILTKRFLSEKFTYAFHFMKR